MSKLRHSYHGWINLNKPLHLTSADAVFQVKRLIHPTKIGHAGTLDPLATGVLPLALGEGTKCVNLLMDAKKTYEFSVTFGERRTTDDAEGEVVETSDILPSAEEIRAVLPRFTGEIMQTPPIYSALKVAGRRAYDLARAGEEVVLAPRPVTVYSFEFLGLEREVEDDTSLADHYHAPSPNPLPQGERAFPPEGVSETMRASVSLKPESSDVDTHSVVPLPLRERLGEGATHLRSHLPLAKEEQALDRAHWLRQESTEAEKKLWHALRNRQLGGHKFRRQHPVEHYIVDFVCLEQRLIVELDGSQHAVEIVKDTKRTAYLESQGFRMLRFWNNEVFLNVEGVLTHILEHLARPITQPSPARGEGLPTAPFVTSPPQRTATAHFRAVVSKGTYIRSLGRDIAQALGSQGYISRLHRAAVGPFCDTDAISLDFLAESVHKAPPSGESPWLTPLLRALDDIPAITLDGGQLQQLRHGQRVALGQPHPDTPQVAVVHAGQLVALARVEGDRLIPVRLLVL